MKNLIPLLYLLIVFPGFSRNLSYHFGQSKDQQRPFDAIVQNYLQAKTAGDQQRCLRSLNELASLTNLKADEVSRVFLYVNDGIKNLHSVTDKASYGNLLFKTGLLYQNLNPRKDSAVYFYKEALAVRLQESGAMSLPVAECYSGLGDVYNYYLNEFLLAELYYEKVIHIWSRLRFDNEYAYSRLYYSLAAINRSQRDFEKALSYGIKAIQLIEKSGNLRFLEQALTNVANIYRDIGQTSTAKPHYLRAIQLNIQTRNSPEVLAWHYESLGETLRKDSLYKESIDYFLKARSIYKKTNISFQPLIVHCLTQLAEVHLLDRNYKRSLETYHELIALLKSLRKMEGKQAADAYEGLGYYYQCVGNYDSALYYYQKGISSAVRSFSPTGSENPNEDVIGESYYIHSILKRKASLLREKFQLTGQMRFLDESLKCLVLSERLMSSERNTMDFEDSKWRFLDSNFNIYEEIISALSDKLEVAAADSTSIIDQIFFYFELSKSRTLANAISDAEFRGDFNSEDSLLGFHYSIKKEIFSAQNKLNSLLNNRPADSSTIYQLRDLIVTLDQKALDIKRRLQEKYPAYYKVKYEAVLPTLTNVRRSLESDQVILEYFFGTQNVYGLLISRNRIMFKALGTVSEINTRIKPVVEFFNQPSSVNESYFRDFYINSVALYSTLMSPFTPQIGKEARLVLIPDGPLSLLPFEALVEVVPGNDQINYHQLKYLLRTHSIGYAYSASSFLYKERERISQPSVLGMASSDDFVSEGISFQGIPGAATELNALSARISDGKFFIGSQATESNFKKFASSFDIIHLALHGTGSTDENSSSIFFNTAADSVEDNVLHFYELYGLNLKARLVVLTACQSALGKTYRGEGMLSMASAFAYSGSQNILMSLWKTNDQASANMMSDFYEHLLAGRSVDDALRRAKLEYLDNADELSANPKVWAMFVAFGNQSPIVGTNWNRTIYVLCAFIGIVLFVTFLFKIRRYGIG